MLDTKPFSSCQYDEYDLFFYIARILHFHFKVIYLKLELLYVNPDYISYVNKHHKSYLTRIMYYTLCT